MLDHVISESAPARGAGLNYKAIVQRVDRTLTAVGAWTTFLVPLLTRLVIGYAFYATGHGKLGNLDNVTSFFESLGIPAPHANAVFVSSLECFGGIALILGVFTRPIAALLGGTMVVALLTADNEAFLGALRGADDKGLTDVVPVVLGMFLFWLMMYGPGMLSIDAIIRRQLENLGWVAPAKTEK